MANQWKFASACKQKLTQGMCAVQSKSQAGEAEEEREGATTQGAREESSQSQEEMIVRERRALYPRLHLICFPSPQQQPFLNKISSTGHEQMWTNGQLPVLSSSSFQADLVWDSETQS